MAWIESHQELAYHPKVARLAKLLDVSVPTAIGHLHCFWWWCMSYADDGDLDGFQPFEIAHGSQWQGDPDVFVKALESAGWVDGLFVHDWWDYAGKLVERRRVEAERKRKSRAKDDPTPSAGHPAPVASTQPTNPTNQTAPAADVQFEVFHRERAVEEVRRRRSRGIRIRSEGGLAKTIAEDEDFRAESTRIYEHQTCKRCRGKGSIDLHAPGGDATINCPGEEQ